MQQRPLSQVARVIRSKNCSPFTLTLDIILPDRPTFDAVQASGVLNREAFARLYRCGLEDVGDVIHYPPALAVKVTIRRLKTSGSFGDSDVYGAQQHGPLLDGLLVPVP
ncbi:hypothetical protein J2T57_003599 [Natronocella acetinitrilica]|uniref:DUF4387 domain-containing protein n=1 Tax=Natronocella acetinitrilica TaxID=414046 RepID=A0AAE3G8K2_9GAMM|nr:DUF4387 domain-containing protein [Natronocella acetinitrilica]MCP1676438.1 hypothetical protein [Natronocella acetinitrilica]